MQSGLGRSSICSIKRKWRSGRLAAEIIRTEKESRQEPEERKVKKRTGKFAKEIFVTGVAALMLTACGGSAGTTAQNAESYDEAVADTAASYDYGGGFYSAGAEAVEEEYAVDDVAEEGAAGTEMTEVASPERKLIKNVNISVETEQFDSLMPAIEQRVAALGGYIEDMSSYSRGETYSPDYQGTKYLRYANMTVRIPRNNLETFLDEIGEKTNVVSRSESVTDVTLQYVDLESHKKALLTEQERLLELMEQAETVEDIIAIEGRLSEVRYQIESMESQLRTYDNEIDYSTVYLNIDEVEHYSPSEGASAGERIRSGFMESVEGVSRGIRNSAIWFVVNIPYLLVWAVVIAIVVLIVRAVVKRTVKRNSVRKAQRENPYLKPPALAPQAENRQSGNRQGEENRQSGNRQGEENQ